MLSVGILSIAVVLFAIQFKNIKPEYGVYITLAGCIVIVSCIVLKLEDIITLMDRLSDLTAVSKGYIKILLKITGITFIADIAISNQVKIFGKISILAISLPVFSELIKTVGELLSQ
jgi:stage III sporulation protein AD